MDETNQKTLTALQKNHSRKEKIKNWIKDTGNQIPLAVLLAIIIGILIKESSSSAIPTEVIQIINLPGNLWIRGLKAVVIPLIFTSMILSMQSLKKIPGGGSKIAKGALGFYFFSTIFALFEAIIFANLILIPNLKDMKAEGGEAAKGESLAVKTTGLILGIIPENVIGSMVKTDLIAVITTGIVIGCLLKDSEESPSAFMRIVCEIERVVTVIVHFLIKISPVGIFFLILPSLMETSFSVIMGSIKWFLITLSAAFSFHMFIFYPLIFFILVRENPFSYFKTFLPVALTAFGTASSAATMPLAVECAHNAGIRRYIYQFLVPLGTALNMNGTAINFPIQITFIALSTGRIFTVVDFCLLGFVAFLATVGATPIPASGIAFMMMMMSSLNLPVNKMFELLIAMEWLIERPETVVNCMGDSIAYAFCQKTLLGIPLDAALNGAYSVEEQSEVIQDK